MKQAMHTTSIDKFPLKWRWTEEKYCLFSENELAQITPLAPSSANVVWRTSLRFTSEAGDMSPSTSFFERIERIDAEDEDAVREWLSKKLPATEVIVSWQPDVAVLVNTELIVKRWSEFCYAGSDDLSFWPLNESWVVHCSHENILWYGKSVNL